MKRIILIFCSVFTLSVSAQNYGDLPRIAPDLLLRDLDLLQQGLESFHTGLYWYSPKDSLDQAFADARAQIKEPMNVMEFHKLIAPLVALTREDHTNIFLPTDVKKEIRGSAKLFPLSVVFLNGEMYCEENGSELDGLRGKKIHSINGKSPAELVKIVGRLFASDGYIFDVKYFDLGGLGLALYHYYEFGEVDSFSLLVGEGSEKKEVEIQAATVPEVIARLKKRREAREKKSEDPGSLEFRILGDSIGYLAVHSFGSSAYKDNPVHTNYKRFLKESFMELEAKGIETLVVDVSQNGGGREGNENLLFSYLGENYQKYTAVRAKTRRTVLDNGSDKPIKLSTFFFLERMLHNRKQTDGSYERKLKAGHGLMAYKKEPKTKFKGKLYVLVGPATYSGGSEFANMVYTRQRGTFVGEETGGGFYGNTSGYSQEVTLPHSQISVDIPALQFMMNVKGLPFGRGVIPHYQVYPTIDEYLRGENVYLNHVLKLEGESRQK